MVGVWFLYRGLQPSLAAQMPVAASPAMTVPTETDPASSGAADVPGDGFGIVPGPATPWAVAGGPGEPTATPVPVDEPPAAMPLVSVDLLGPPAESFFQPEDEVTFFWTGAEPLAAGRRYVVYLVNGEEQLVLGDADRPNLGQGFRVRGVPGQIVGEAGDFGWLVALEDSATGDIIGTSKTRRITLLAAN